MVQILSGLITYFLLAIYCREQHNEKVSIKRVRELRIKIQNETRIANNNMVRSILSQILQITKFQTVMQAPNRKLLYFIILKEGLPQRCKTRFGFRYQSSIK